MVPLTSWVTLGHLCHPTDVLFLPLQKPQGIEMSTKWEDILCLDADLENTLIKVRCQPCYYGGLSVNLQHGIS